MVDEKKLANFWNNDVPDEFKHISGTEFDKKISKYKKDINENLIENLDFSKIQIALEWGCGGGIITLELAKYCKQVDILDISSKSIYTCTQLLKKFGLSPGKTYLIDDLDTLKITGPIDLILSTSVIQHFPSFNYFKRVAKLWLEIAPKFLAIQTRHGEKVKDNEQMYYDDIKNYILALYLPTNEVVRLFSNKYDLDYNYLDDDGYSMYEYFIFKRKQ